MSPQEDVNAAKALARSISPHARVCVLDGVPFIILLGRLEDTAYRVEDGRRATHPVDDVATASAYFDKCGRELIAFNGRRILSPLQRDAVASARVRRVQGDLEQLANESRRALERP